MYFLQIATGIIDTLLLLVLMFCARECDTKEQITAMIAILIPLVMSIICIAYHVV